MDFDFNSVRDRIITKLSLKHSWEDILFFSTNNYLINAFAEEIDGLAQHNEFLTRETKWDIAMNKSSLVTASSFRNYDVKRKIGASGTVRISKSQELLTSPEWSSLLTYATDDYVRYENKLYQALVDSPSGTPDSSADWMYIDNTHVASISIPKWTVVVASDGTQYTVIQDYSMDLTEEFKDVEVIQGIPQSANVKATGVDFEIIDVLNDSFEDVLYEVYINDSAISEIDDIYNAAENQKTYEINTRTYGDGVYIKFGNGNFGYKLDSADYVKVRYLETLGESGEALSLGVIQKVFSDIYDSDSNKVDMYAYNYEQIDGGKEADTLEEIRAKAPKTFQAGQRATTADDYSVLLQENSLVFKSVVWGAYEYHVDKGLNLWEWVPLEENRIHVSIIPTTGEFLTELQKTEIIESIKDSKSPTDIIDFVTPEYVYLAFTIDARILDTSYQLSVVKTNIINLVETKYDISNRKFKQNVYETQWKGEISAIGGISYHTSYIELISFTNFNTPLYEADILLPVVPILAGSVQVYLKDTSVDTNPWVLIAVDDGTGGFTAEAGYTLTGSSVNYNEGYGFLKASGGVTGTYSDYSIKIYYRPDDLDFLLTKRNQIFRYSEIRSIDVAYA